MKQMIEIDVLDGYEIDKSVNHGSTFGCPPHVITFFKKKEPEYIEVREYFIRYDGVVNLEVHHKTDPEITSDIEARFDFLKWKDFDWRKVKV